MVCRFYWSFLKKQLFDLLFRASALNSFDFCHLLLFSSFCLACIYFVLCSPLGSEGGVLSYYWVETFQIWALIALSSPLSICLAASHTFLCIMFTFISMHLHTFLETFPCESFRSVLSSFKLSGGLPVLFAVSFSNYTTLKQKICCMILSFPWYVFCEHLEERWILLLLGEVFCKCWLDLISCYGECWVCTFAEFLFILSTVVSFWKSPVTIIGLLIFPFSITRLASYIW